MKHISFSWLLLVLLGAFSYAQEGVHMSLRVAPTFSFSRVINETAGVSAESGGPTLKFSGGLMADIFLAENVGISTGVWYMGKRAQAEVEGSPINYFNYNLQYIEIPFLFKGYTNNITEKMNLYFQTGIVTGICVGEKYADDNIPSGLPDDDFSDFIDFTWLIGAGVEMSVGTSNKAYFGLDYGHGLYNVLSTDYLNSTTSGAISINKFAIKNSYIALVSGFKF